MKRVVTLPELYKLIPETLKLESGNYDSLKEVLESAIHFIEKSGKWSFVQYVPLFVKDSSGNRVQHMLFIIEDTGVITEKEVNDRSSSVSAQTEISEHYNAISKIAKPPEKIVVDRVEIKPPKKTAKVKDPKDGNGVFTETQLPW